MPLDDLINIIETLKKRMTTHRQSLQQNETRTRVALIDPLLTALGWDVQDPGLVTPEYTVGQGRADYALNGSESNRIPAAIVEAKRLGHALNDAERMQMLNYASARGIRHAAVTDGDVWELYEVFKPTPLEDRRLLNVKIVSTPAHRLALQLLLLWRPNLVSGEPVAAQEPIWNKTRNDTAEAFHQPVDTPSVPLRSALPSAIIHQPKQHSASCRIAQYCVDGENWISCPDATALMLSIVEWCAQQHRDGADHYCEKLSHTCFKGNQTILIKEIVTETTKRDYSKQEMNGWHVFYNLTNSDKNKIIEAVLKACVRQDGTSPVLEQDLQVKMRNG